MHLGRIDLAQVYVEQAMVVLHERLEETLRVAGDG